MARLIRSGNPVRESLEAHRVSRRSPHAPPRSSPRRPATVRPTKWVEHLVRHLSMAREGVDPEGVHQVRVAGRRLRVWLNLGGHRALGDDLRWLVQVLGRLRDLDVLCALPVGDLGPFAEWLGARRTAAHDEAAEVLGSFRIEGLCRALEVLPPLKTSKARAVLGDLEADVAKRSRGWVEAKAWTLPPEAALEELHRLRRALRRVRYGREWLGEPDALLPVVQDVLGAVCDVAALLRLLDAWCAETATAAPVSRDALLEALAAMLERAWLEWAALGRAAPPRLRSG